MRIKKDFKILITLMSIILFLFSCSSKNDPIASFKNGQVLRKELAYALNKLPEQKQDEYKSSNKKLISLIKKIALKKIIADWAKSTNIINYSQYTNDLKREKESQLFTYVLNNKVDAPERKAKSSDIKKFNSTISVRLIWLKTFFGMPEKEVKKVKKLAYEIYDKIDSGESFGKLANKYSSDRNNYMYGRLNNISKKDVSQEIYNALKKMNPGDISDIIEDSNSFQIIKLTKILPNDKFNIERIYIKKQDKDAKEKLNQALKLIKKGFLFGIIANEFTQDNNNFRDGKIMPFRYDSIYLKIADTAFNLDDGEVCKPLETRYGYFIIKKESVKLPDKKTIEKLSKNDRYLNRIKIIKSRFVKYLNQDKLIKKIISKYNIVFNKTALMSINITNKDTVVAEVPELNVKIKYNEVEGIIKRQTGPRRKDDLLIREENILNRFILKKLVYDYSVKKGWDKDDEFILKLNDNFYSRLYNAVTAKLKLNIKISDKDVREFYEKNKYEFYKTKIVNHKPKRVLMPFKEAKDIAYRKLTNKKRKELLEKWENKLLKEYNFKIIYKNLSLKKDYDYYIEKAVNYINQGKYDKALKNLKKAIKLNPSNLEAYIKSYIVYTKKGDIKKSIEIFEKVKKLNSADSKILIKEYDTADNKLKLKLIELMAKFPTSDIIKKLINIYSNSTNAAIKESSIRSLGQAKAIEAFDILFNDLKNFNKVFADYPEKEKEIIKWYLIEALGYIGNTDATDYLVKTLNKSKDVNLKCFVLEALGRIKDKKSVPVLKRYLKDKVWGVRVLAAESLKNITGEDYKIEPPKNIKKDGNS